MKEPMLKLIKKGILNVYIQDVLLKSQLILPRRCSFYLVFSYFLASLTKSNSLQKKFCHDIQLITSKLMECGVL